MSPVLTCPDCSTPFAVDQRYCTHCGYRLRALPRPVATTLAAMRASGGTSIGADRLNTTAAGAGGASSATRSGPRLMLFGQPLELPTPRTMAVAVLMVLVFGVIISTNSFSLASSPLLVNVNRPAGAAPAATPPALSSPSASSPAVSGGGGGGGGSSAAPSTPASSGNSGSTGDTGASGNSGNTSTTASSNGLPPIKHVWIIQLGDQGYAQTFASTSPDTYLNTTLAKQGEVVPYVYASATSDLANEIGLISGQGPTVQTEDDCPTYENVTPGTLGSDGQVSGDGCVYPYSTESLESELSTKGDSWKAYVQGQSSVPAPASTSTSVATTTTGATSATTTTGAATTGTTESPLATSSCMHPTLGATDPNASATSLDGYVTWRNPFVYLSDVTLGGCSSEDVGLDKLKSDLSSSATTPNVSFIYANPCNDGSDAPCLAGAPSGTAQSDTFLQSIIPEIESSAAYKADGMILITFAQAPQSGPGADHSSCCDQPAQFPNLPSPDYVPGSSGDTATTTTATTGTSTAPPATTTASTATTVSIPATDTITVGGLTSPLGTTTAPQGIVTGIDTSTTATETSTTGTTTTGTTPASCPTAGTTTTASGTTSTAAATTTSAPGTGTADTGTTAAGSCCPASTATTTGTTTTGTSTASATTTATTGTGTTGTGTTGSAGTSGCPGTAANASPTGGGGQVGMLVLSKYVKADEPDPVDYFNTFSITASLEQLFGLKPTGYAATTGLPVFTSFFYSNFNNG